LGFAELGFFGDGVERCFKWKHKQVSLPVFLSVDFLREDILLGWIWPQQVRARAIMKAEAVCTGENVLWIFLGIALYMANSQILQLQQDFLIVNKKNLLSDKLLKSYWLQKSHIWGFIRLKNLYSHASNDLTCGSFTVGGVSPMAGMLCPEGLVFLDMQSPWNVAASSLDVNNSWFPLVLVQEQLICNASCCQLQGTFSLGRGISYRFLFSILFLSFFLTYPLYS